MPTNLALQIEIPMIILCDILYIFMTFFPGAILGKKTFRLLDQPTSGVDTITDAKIQNALFRLLRGLTAKTIAHRLRTFLQYDWIIELENGKLKRTGNLRIS